MVFCITPAQRYYLTHIASLVYTECVRTPSLTLVSLTSVCLECFDGTILPVWDEENFQQGG